MFILRNVPYARVCANKSSARADAIDRFRLLKSIIQNLRKHRSCEALWQIVRMKTDQLEYFALGSFTPCWGVDRCITENDLIFKSKVNRGEGFSLPNDIKCTTERNNLFGNKTSDLHPVRE
jgi:hypothetical protein